MKFIKGVTIVLAIALIVPFVCGCGSEKEPEKGNQSSQISSKIENTIATSATEDPQGGETGRPLGEVVNVKEITSKKGLQNGIDVSKWQGKIDWSKVKSQGIDFAVIRIGYRGENGNIYKDEYADYNIQQADKAGVLVGVYDCEGFTKSDSRMYNLGSKQKTDNALSFINTIKNFGYEAMFYASKNDLLGEFETQRIENVAKIWIAHFDGKIYPEVQNPQYSGKYSMWQYTNKGVVEGVNSDVDLVVSYEQFSKKAPLENGVVSEVQAPKPVDNTYKSVSDRVTAKYQVNLRESATSTSAQVGVLNAGEYLERTAIGSNGWSKLIFGGKTVYAVSSYLTNEENYQKPQENSQTSSVSDGYTVTNDKVTPKNSVNLRREPTTNSEVVVEISNGTVLERLAKNNDKGWSKISYNGEVLYAVSQYLTADLNYKPYNSEPPSDQNNEMFFHKTADRVTAKTETNLRSNPAGGEDSQVVYLLKNGEVVERTGYSDRGWSRVIWQGQTLYAVTSYLEVMP